MGKAVDEVLIVGASSRGLAESAATAGFRVLAVDAYGDLDLLARAHTIALRRDLGVDWSPRAAVTAADRFPAAALIGTGTAVGEHVQARLGVVRIDEVALL